MKSSEKFQNEILENFLEGGTSSSLIPEVTSEEIIDGIYGGICKRISKEISLEIRAEFHANIPDRKRFLSGSIYPSLAQPIYFVGGQKHDNLISNTFLGAL